MSQTSETEGLQARRRSMTRRAKDFSVLVGTAGMVLLVLVLTGSLGWIEALSGIFVIGSVASAYYVGSASLKTGGGDVVSVAASTPDSVLTTDLLAALPLPAFEVSRDQQRIVAYNEPAASFLRLGPRRSAPPRASVIIRTPALLAAIETCLAAPEGVSSSLELEIGPDEHWRAHIHSVRASDSLLVLLEDLTPVKRAARARADFLANASHELRTPLTAISGFIETMRGPAREDKDSWDRFLAIMAGETERMSRLIADLLSLSRIESTEHMLPTAREHFADIVMNSVDALLPLASDRGVELVVEGAEDLPDVTANWDELVQVAENLISNAIKYSGTGSRVVVHCGVAADGFEARSLAAQLWEGSERMTLLQTPNRVAVNELNVWMRVEDQGPGIEREHLPRLGERFYRADQSRGGKITGTGLGLAIVKHIMTHHRGGLAVETRIGEGTAFGVWLPAAKDAPPD
ncbi:two-component sensor histidine kinase [Hyphomonas sp. WL0036]|uniref:sensor histidine kinase n=1 Tax=Hyphomonas sediminis TaxID=2866160 RepID=UPI001C82494F|nr:ATP-binding protein [Hyphomonas sediminis]MBY9066500.1 two-component sensor histidine kinase [Hyphomonas sediminis]